MIACKTVRICVGTTSGKEQKGTMHVPLQGCFLWYAPPYMTLLAALNFSSSKPHARPCGVV